MKGLWDRVHIQLYYLFTLADLFLQGRREREVSAHGNLCANKHKDQKSLSTTPKLRHLLYKGKSHESKCDKDKRYFCISCFVKILSLLQSIKDYFPAYTI